MVHIYFHTFFLSQALTLTNARLFGGDSEKRNLIIGGGEAEKGRYPYMVSFQHENSHFCGGSLIAPDVVLTAAHCESPYSFAVIGRHHWMKEKEGEAIEISEQLPHPDFNFTGDDYDGDIMLLFLERPVADDVPIVKLNSDSSVPEVDSPVTVLGWGDTDIDWLNFEMSDVLKSAEVYVESNEECKESEGLIQGDPAWYMDHVTENMLCAEAEGTDSCQTDSGGPLVILGVDSTEDIQVGIVSWGYSCAHQDFPGVYTRISSYYEWVRQHVCEKSSHPPVSFHCFDGDNKEQKIIIEFDVENGGEEVANKVEIDIHNGD